MGGHIIHTSRGRPVGRMMIIAACLLAVAVGIGLSRLIGPGPSPRPSPTIAARAADPKIAEVATVPTAGPAASLTSAAAVICPLQSMSLTLDGGATKTVCMDATNVQQTGDVRSYVVNAGDAEGWTLKIDMVERQLHRVSLRARDGRSYACEAPQCKGSAGLIQASAAQKLSLRELRVPRELAPGAAVDAGADSAMLSAELRVPADEQVPGLACIGPSLSIATSSGTNRNFCGQGGAGVEIAENGRHNYRFQDFEGQTLMIAVDADQRVIGIELEPYSCQGAACTGASTSSAMPDNPLAERSFYFGRTALFAAGGRQPALSLNGTLVIPSQQ